MKVLLIVAATFAVLNLLHMVLGGRPLEPFPFLLNLVVAAGSLVMIRSESSR